MPAVMQRLARHLFTFCSAVSLLLLLLACRPAAAWSVAGHMVSGAIAFDLLKQDDPQALARVLNTLREHPQYADPFVTKLVSRPPEDRDLFLFMLAARWPDDVRRNAEYHRGPWHYINFPFKPAGQPATVTAPPPAEPNILTAYAENLAIVKGDGAAGEKAVALCWLMHLVGDAHQPLHTVSLFTTEYPVGDRGGNRIFIRARPGGAILNLHKLWDGLILGAGRFTDARNEATRLRLREDLAHEKLPELSEQSFERWAQESFELAKRLAYLDGKSLGSPTRDNATPVLPEGYLAKAKAVAERRIVLAGYRLADVLREAVQK
jgi:hypothetical protein